ncbi:MAG: transcriptional repressor [Planctomycetes bacterium]|nr:transcriptional repressor [Planctomycetota bacterium]
MRQVAIRSAFEAFLKKRSLKLTTQRRRIFDRAFVTHEHFSAERLYRWMLEEPGTRVSRATVYRTLGLLVEGEFMRSLDAGRGELVYEHTLGHPHHDHMVCLGCGKIEEFSDPKIEELQLAACARKGFELVDHDLRLLGYCRACKRTRPERPAHLIGVERSGNEAARAATREASGAGE